MPEETKFLLVCARRPPKEERDLSSFGVFGRGARKGLNVESINGRVGGKMNTFTNLEPKMAKGLQT